MGGEYFIGMERKVHRLFHTPTQTSTGISVPFVGLWGEGMGWADISYVGNSLPRVTLDGLVTGQILVSVGRVTSDVVRVRDAKH